MLGQFLWGQRPAITDSRPRSALQRCLAALGEGDLEEAAGAAEFFAGRSGVAWMELDNLVQWGTQPSYSSQRCVWDAIDTARLMHFRGSPHSAWWLALASMHRNGFVRYRALQFLEGEPENLPLAVWLLRLGDEVPLVRELARHKVTHAREPERWTGSIELLLLRNRQNLPLPEVFHFLSRQPELIEEGLAIAAKERRRDWARKVLSCNPGAAELLMKSADGWVRALAAGDIPHSQLVQQDKDPAVRAAGVTGDGLVRHLLDPAPKVRFKAMELAWQTGVDPSVVYRENLRALPHICLRGLEECGAPGQVEVMEWLDHSDPSIRAAALRALRVMFPEKAVEAARRLIDDPSRKVLRTVLWVLGNDLSPWELADMVKRTPDAWKMLLRRHCWEALEFCLESGERFRLDDWKQRYAAQGWRRPDPERRKRMEARLKELGWVDQAPLLFGL